MHPILQRFRHPKKRTYLRGVVVGLITHYAAVAVFLVAIFLFRPFFWAAVYGVPYTPSPGPVDPNSTEGAFLHTVSFLSWVPAGAAAMHWSTQKSRPWSALTLFSYLASLSLLAFSIDIQAPIAVGRALWYWLSAPLGLGLGVITYLSRANSVANIATVDSQRDA